MRVLRVLVLLLPMLAFAGWRQVSAVGPVQDLQVVDAGMVLTSSSTTGVTLWHVSDAGVTSVANLPGSYVGGGTFGAGCLLGLAPSGNLAPSGAGCGVATALGVGTWQRFRLISDAPYGVAVVTNSNNDTLWSGPGAALGWGSRGPALLLSSGTRTLQNARIGGVDYAVAGNPGAGIRVSVDGGNVPGVGISGTTAWIDAVPFPLAGAPAILGATTTALTLLRDYRTPTPFTPAIPAGASPRAVAMGTRLGMVTTGSGQLLGPIPDPARPAETWVVRGAPPATLFADRVNCLDDRYCVTATDAGMVWFYENEFTPTIEVVLPQLDAGQTIRLVADAGDGDGDPIFVSWTGGDGVFTPVSGVDDGTEVDFTAPVGVCAPSNIAVSVTDGLTTRSLQLPLTVINRGNLSIDGGNALALAGGPPLVFSAFLGGGCPPAGPIAWSTSEGQSGAGNQFSWTPPCAVSGTPITITATATWSSGLPATTSVSNDVTVQDWVLPPAPVFTPSTGTQQSGTVVDWLWTGAEHVCSTSAGYPGTQMVWTIDGGGLSPQIIDGGLRIDAPRCARFPVQVTASAIRRVVGQVAGSDAGTLTVDVVPDAPPLDANTGFSITAEGDGGRLFGTFQVDAGCLAERGATVNISVSSGGAPVGSDDRPASDGSWSIGLTGGCAGGVYDVTAQLSEGGVFTGASDQKQVTLPFSPAQVGALSLDRIDVTCGGGASAPLRLLPAPNACGVAEVSWRATSGPPLVNGTGTGETIALQTEALDFSVVGQQVALEFTADAGAGNVDVATRTLELGVQPFLELSVKARPPLRREEEGVSLEVTIHNPTDCQVDGISLTLPFSGGSPLLETALLDGHRVPARATDEGVVIDQLRVPPRGDTKLQLTARARLLSTPTVTPVASLNGYVVSSLAPVPDAPTGCGCSELASPAWMALLTLVLRRRRRTSG